MNEYIVDLVTNAGPMVALVLYFVWADSKRDQRNEEEKRELARYIRDRLDGIITENQATLRHLEQIIRDARKND